MTAPIPFNTSRSPIWQLARLVRTLNRREKAHLLQLVPDLQTISPEEAGIAPEQVTLMDSIHDKFPELSEPEPLEDDEPFLADLTFPQFFALPEEEQARIWNKAYAEAEREIGIVEYPARPDALSAR